MARIAIPEQFADDPQRAAYQLAGAMGDAGKNFSRTVYQETKLPYRVVEAARVRTAQINGCLTCQTWRSARDYKPVMESFGGDVARSFLGSAEALPGEEFYADVAAWRTSSQFNDRERLAIEFAERMGERPHSFRGDEAFWTQMHRHFSDAEIVDLTFSIGSWIAAGRMLHILEVDPEVCPLQPQEPAWAE